MLNFNYYNPTQIVFGSDRLGELDQLVPQNAKVMITYGGSSAKKYGTIDKVVKALGKRKIVEFSGIEPNPQFDTLSKAIELGKKEGVDFTLAVGGGSVMDGTKFISIGLKHEGDYSEIFNLGFGGIPENGAANFGCVATLPATGSEMNAGAVITHQGVKKVVMSPVTFPKFSFLDPGLTKTLPKEQVANGIADSFIHVAEQYLTFPVGAKIQDRFSEGIMKTLLEVGPQTLATPDDEEARKNFIWSTTMALNGLIGSGVPQDWATHMIGHELTATYGIAHGRTLAIILPSLLRERKDKKRAKLLQFAERVWNLQEGTEDQKIDQAIDRTEEFFKSLGISTKLSDYGIDQAGVDKVVSNLESQGMVALSETQDQTIDITKKILERAL